MTRIVVGLPGLITEDPLDGYGCSNQDQNSAQHAAHGNTLLLDRQRKWLSKPLAAFCRDEHWERLGKAAVELYELFGQADLAACYLRGAADRIDMKHARAQEEAQGARAQNH